MATKAKQSFNVYFDIPKVQVMLPIVANTLEDALIAARELDTYKILYSAGIEYTEYEAAELNGIYKN